VGSPLEKHADFLLALIEVEPDLTLDEVVCAMHKCRIPGSRTAVWRLFQRHEITFAAKRSNLSRATPNRSRPTAGAPPTNGETASTLDANKRSFRSNLCTTPLGIIDFWVAGEQQEREGTRQGDHYSPPSTRMVASARVCTCVASPGRLANSVLHGSEKPKVTSEAQYENAASRA
jgi:hypothetical protein